MKKKYLLIYLIANAFFFKLTAQNKTDLCCLSQKMIIGTWQRNDSIVGNGLDQHFIFSKNNYFIFNIGNDADDVRNIIQLKGKYRLDKDKIYFTIISKKIIEGGEIGISDPGVSPNLFNIEKGKVKDIPVMKPKEINDPCHITVISNKNIKINNEIYFKVND